MLKVLKRLLQINTLESSHFDVHSKTHELIFDLGGSQYLVKNIQVDGDVDEFHWDEEVNVKRAVEQADESDIELLE